MTLTDLDPHGPNNLTEEEATLRAFQISGVTYDISLDIKGASPQYSGQVTVHFHYVPSPNMLSYFGTFLEFIGKTIHTISLNDTDLSEPADQPHHTVFKSNRIHLPAHLLKDKNHLVVSYTNEFDHTGSGFHQFIDPEDKSEYLFTDFEPFEAHRLFPCFDQPSIKAKYRVTVTAPAEWEVIANNPIATSTVAENDTARKTYQYAETPPFSTYLFAIVAGPYESFSDKCSVNGKEIPLRILCRKSLTKYMKADLEELFTVTKQGMQFYSDFFNYVYPFDKYDQIWVPEFNQGAMENVGCVTFTERYIFRESPTEARKCGRADTVLHELAHMWFGNLVSPMWWDGLWLNESFATYMAALSLANATRFKDLSWQEFNSSMKRWAEREDQQSTTHPIQGSVVDTESTFLNFDGITYGKGASVLKQLTAVISEEAFKLGMRFYFEKHQWGNTSLLDFLKALEYGYNTHHANQNRQINLVLWSQKWLETAGINTLIPQFEVVNGKVSTFSIQQMGQSEEHPTLRPHTLEVSLFTRENNTPRLTKTVTVVVGEAPSTTVEELVGVPAPDFVFINYNDHAYAKVFLDPISLKFVLSYLHELDNPLLRQLLWNTLSHMVRDQKLSSIEYLALIREKLGVETNTKLMQSVLQSAEGTIHFYVPDSLKVAEATKFSEFALRMLQSTQDTDARIMWANSAINTALEEIAVKKLVEMMDKGTNIPGFELDQQMRWNLINKMAGFGFPDASDRITQEEQKDPSDRGIRAATSARASFPDSDTKAKAYERIRTDKDSSFHIIRSVMSGFRWWHQRTLLQPYEDKFFEEIRNIFKDQTKEYSGAFFATLFPFYPEDDMIIQRSKQLLESLPADEKVLIRKMKEKLDDLERSRKCRQFCK